MLRLLFLSLHLTWTAKGPSAFLISSKFKDSPYFLELYFLTYLPVNHYVSWDH